VPQDVSCDFRWLFGRANHDVVDRDRRWGRACLRVVPRVDGDPAGEVLERRRRVGALDRPSGRLGIGRELIDLVWSPTYRPVFGPIAVILVSHIFLFSGALFEALLNLHGRAAIASLNMLGFTIATLAGTGMVLAADSAWIALWVAGVQAAAAGLYAMTGYLTLGLKKGIWLPIGRAFLPPIALGAILSASGELPDPAPASVAIALGLFLLAVPLLAIVRISEVRQILGALTGKKARTGV